MESKPANDTRERAGRRLARVVRIERVGRLWKVPSQTSPAHRYLVDLERGTCTCPDYELRQGTCKHQHAIYYWIAWGRDDDGGDGPTGAAAAEGGMSDSAQNDNRQYPPAEGWKKYREGRRKEWGCFRRLLYSFCAQIPGPSRNDGPGRNPLRYCDEVFCAVMKMYLNKSSDLVLEALKECFEKGLIRKVPHPNSISNFLDDEATTDLLLPLVPQLAAPLRFAEEGQFAADATGMSTTPYVRWFDFRDGKHKAKHLWIKLHVLVGTKTKAIIAVKVDRSPEHEAQQLEELIRCGSRYHTIEQLSADNAYASKVNFEFLDEMGITPFIKLKDTYVADPKCRPWTEALMEFWFNKGAWLPNYHRRSNVESAFSSLKQVMGPTLRSKRPHALVNETLCKCLAHNMRCVIRAINAAQVEVKLWPGAPDLSEEAA